MKRSWLFVALAAFLLLPVCRTAAQNGYGIDYFHFDGTDATIILNCDRTPPCVSAWCGFHVKHPVTFEQFEYAVKVELRGAETTWRKWVIAHGPIVDGTFPPCFQFDRVIPFAGDWTKTDEYDVAPVGSTSYPSGQYVCTAYVFPNYEDLSQSDAQLEQDAYLHFQGSLTINVDWSPSCYDGVIYPNNPDGISPVATCSLLPDRTFYGNSDTDVVGTFCCDDKPRGGIVSGTYSMRLLDNGTEIKTWDYSALCPNFLETECEALHFDFSKWATGKHTLTLEARDSAGYKGLANFAPGCHSLNNLALCFKVFTIDNQPPSINITCPIGPCICSPFSVQFCVSDDYAQVIHYAIYFDGSSTPAEQGDITKPTGGWPACVTSAGTFSSLAPGVTHTVKVVATDQVGNLASDTKSFGIPTPASLSNGTPTGDCNCAPVTIGFKLGGGQIDGVAACAIHYIVYVDGVLKCEEQNATPGDKKCPPSGPGLDLVSGTHHVKVVASVVPNPGMSCSGQCSQATLEWDFKIPPKPVLSNGTPTGDCVCSPTTIGFDVAPTGMLCPVDYKVYLDGGTTPVCTGQTNGGHITCPNITFAPGTHTVVVKASNACFAADDLSWTFKSPPKPVLSNGTPTGDCVCSPTTIGFDVAPTGMLCPVTYNVYLDGGATPVCTGQTSGGHVSCPNITFGPGTHTVVVKASNVCFAADDLSWTFKSPPKPVLSNGTPTGDCVCSPTTIGFDVAPTGMLCPVTYNVYLDGGTTPVCTGQTSGGHVTCPNITFGPGTHTIVVKASNVCLSADDLTWTFKSPPKPVLSNGTPTGDCVCSPTTIGFDVSPTGMLCPVDYKVYLDGGTTPVCSGQTFGGHVSCPNITFTTSGTHTVVVKAWNVCFAANDLTWTFKSPPKPVLSNGTPTGDCECSPTTIGFDVSPTGMLCPVDYKVYLDGGTTPVCSGQTFGGHVSCPNITFTTSGVHTVVVKASNACFAADDLTWTFKSPPKPVLCCGLPTGDCNPMVVTLEFDVSEPGSTCLVDYVVSLNGNTVCSGTTAPGHVKCPGITLTKSGQQDVVVTAHNACLPADDLKWSFSTDDKPPVCDHVTVATKPDGKPLCCPLTLVIDVCDNCPGDIKVEVFEVLANDQLQPCGDAVMVPNCVESPPLPFCHLSPGLHHMRLRMTDLAGNSAYGCNFDVTCATCEGGNCLDCKLTGTPLPNLIVAASNLTDPYSGATINKVFRPEVINIDKYSIRDVLLYNGIKPNDKLVVQGVCTHKCTPTLKCTGFVYGPGAGLNTNFISGWRKATVADLDKSVVMLSFNLSGPEPYLGNRGLLFSPPGTQYGLYVTYVILDANGRPGAPQYAYIEWVVKHKDSYVPLTLKDLKDNIEYFTTIAAGRTQKPKIADDVATALYAALDETDSLKALTDFEAVLGAALTDFSDLMNSPDPRFNTGYLSDSPEEPIDCLLIEMANNLLWR